MPKTKRRKSRRKHDRSPHGLRPFWSGTISFGLVSVPVYLYPGTRHSKTGLRMLNEDGTPLSRRYYCPEENVDVHPEHIVRAFDTGEEEYVVVRDEELEALQPRQSRDIDLRRFVPRGEIPTIFFERAYFLTPAGDSTKAYRLLADVMQRTDRAGIATFVMRGKEYLVAILAEQGILQAETMRFEDELRDPEDVGLPKKVTPDKQQVARFRKAIKRRETDEVDQDDLVDEYSEKLHRLVARKRKEGIDLVEAGDREEPEDESDETSVDLIETIRRSLRREDAAAAGKHNGKHRKSPSAGRSKRGRNQLDDKTKDELYQRAQKLRIPGRSGMTKQELIRAIRDGRS